MKYTATCPACHTETSLISIMLAVTPFSFKCSKCRARIFIRGITWQLLSIMVVMGVAAIALLKFIFYTGKYNAYWYFLMPALVLIALEFLSALIVCNKGRLVAKK
jgi:hypothetical protein